MRATFETKIGQKTFERDASTIRGYMQIIDGKLIHLKVFPVPDPCDMCDGLGCHPCNMCAFGREMAEKAEVA